MGSYYAGIMNSATGRYLMHYRTKGSRNGYSTTPGYIPIGQKAQVLARTTQQYAPGFISRFGNKINSTASTAREIATKLPKKIKKYSGIIANDVKSIPSSAKSASRRIADDLSKPVNVSKEDTDAINRFMSSPRTGMFEMLGRGAVKGYKHAAKKWDEYRDGPILDEDYKSIQRQVIRETGNIDDNGGWDKINENTNARYEKNKKHNQLRKAYKDAEAYYNKVSREYDNAINSRASYKEIERLNRKVEDAYDKFFKAEQAYRTNR